MILLASWYLLLPVFLSVSVSDEAENNSFQEQAT